jgi:hypothetical protein
MKVVTDSKFYRVECELGWRTYVERFRDIGNAREFVRAVLGKDKPKWRSETKIVAKAADTLVIESDDLEAIMESKASGSLGEDTKKKVHDFCFGVWKQSENERQQGNQQRSPQRSTSDDAPPRRAPSGGDGMVTLSDICARRKWDERRMRQFLRKSGEKNEGRWAWAKRDVAAIERKLEGVAK